MKSNRPPRSNMRWRTHKCLKTSWGNMHFCRRSRLTYWSSHCTKHRANVLLNYTSPVHKTLKRHCSQNESYCHCLTLLLHTHWQSDINHPPSTSPVIQSVCAHVVPAFLWWTTGGKNNLPLQLFPPELPGNIIKKGWVWVALMPAAMLQLPSGCHLLPHCKAASTSDLFFFFFRLTPASPLLPSCRQTSLRDTQRWPQEKKACTKMTYTQNGVSAAFVGLWDNWCVSRAKPKIFRWVLQEINAKRMCVDVKIYQSSAFIFGSPWDVPRLSLSSGTENPLLWL